MATPIQRTPAQTAKPELKRTRSRKGLLRAKIPVLLRLPDVRLAGPTVRFRWSDVPWGRLSPAWLAGIAAALMLLTGLWVQSQTEAQRKSTPRLSFSPAPQPTGRGPSLATGQQAASQSRLSPLPEGPNRLSTGEHAPSGVASAGSAAELAGIVVPETEETRHAPIGSGLPQGPIRRR